MRLAVGDLRQDAAAFHGMRGAAMDPKVLVHDVGGLGERRVAVAVSDLVGDDPVRRQFAAHRRRSARSGNRSPPAARRSRPRQALRHPRRYSGRSRPRWRPARRRTTLRRRPARTASSGRAWCRNSKPAPCAAAAAPGRDRRAPARRRRPALRGPRSASMPRISACGCGLRTKAACSAPGAGMSSTKRRAAGQQRKILEPRDPRSDQVAHWPSLEIALVARAMTSFGV